MGWSSRQISALTAQFVAYCAAAGSDAEVLDIGCGYGAAAEAALAAGVHVVANDIDRIALSELHRRIGVNQWLRFIPLPGRFPNEFDLPAGSFAAVHTSNVLHFLEPKELEAGLRKIAAWLRPGGRLFVQAATPYQAPFQDFIPEYERRLEAKKPWPGWVARIGEWSTHRQLGQMPRSIHLLDATVLSRAVTEAGLRVEHAVLSCRADLPVSLRLDGRETVELVAER